MSEPDLSTALEFIQDRLYFVSLRSKPRDTNSRHFFTVDDDLVYEPFFADFGPLNLGMLYRFCQLLHSKLEDPQLKNRRIYFFSSMDPHKRANAAYLIASYTIIYLKRSPEEAHRPFVGIYPQLVHFRDAAYGISTFNLTLLDTLRGLARGVALGWINFDPAITGGGSNSPSNPPVPPFHVEEYEFYERVDNGDMNWIVPGKFLAFSGPAAVRETFPDGMRLFTPEDYVPVFKKWNIRHIVRLNKKVYERNDFLKNGLKHTELYFVDGGTPSAAILRKFLEIAEEEEGAMAVHCKAGLGRTGTLIGCFLMKHFRFTAAECIAYIRICRPGSIIGPQQQFLKDLEKKLWKQGEEFAMKHKITNLGFTHSLWQSIIYGNLPNANNNIILPMMNSITGAATTNSNLISSGNNNNLNMNGTTINHSNPSSQSSSYNVGQVGRGGSGGGGNTSNNSSSTLNHEDSLSNAVKTISIGGNSSSSSSQVMHPMLNTQSQQQSSSSIGSVSRNRNLGSSSSSSLKSMGSSVDVSSSLNHLNGSYFSGPAYNTRLQSRLASERITSNLGPMSSGSLSNYATTTTSASSASSSNSISGGGGSGLKSSSSGPPNSSNPQFSMVSSLYGTHFSGSNSGGSSSISSSSSKLSNNNNNNSGGGYSSTLNSNPSSSSSSSFAATGSSSLGGLPSRHSFGSSYTVNNSNSGAGVGTSSSSTSSANLSSFGASRLRSSIMRTSGGHH